MAAVTEAMLEVREAMSTSRHRSETKAMLALMGKTRTTCKARLVSAIGGKADQAARACLTQQCKAHGL
eukprot:434213-Alexandrium_andersonii.AAC.1